MELSVKQKRLLKWAGYPLLALVTFVFALFYTFPYDRVKGRIEALLAKKYDTTIESVSPTLLPGGVVIKGISLRTRPEEDDGEPRTIFIDRVEADIGLFALMGGDVAVDLSAEVGGGTLSGEVAYGAAGLEAELRTEQLPLKSIPGLQESFGLPMSGGLSAEMKLKLPKMNWQDADGRIELACVGCTVGDGKAKLKMKQPQAGGRRARRWSRHRAMFAGDGITVPRLNLGSTVGELVIEKGSGTIETLKAQSEDGELSMEGDIQFANPVKRSTFELCLKFQLSESLERREPDFGNIDDFQAAQFKQPDGSVAIPLRFDGSRLRVDKHRRCKGAAPPSSGSRARPTISARPAEDEEPAEEEPVEESDPEAVEEEPVEEEEAPEEEELSEEEKARRAGEDGGEEPEVERPGRSGPELSPTRRRTIDRDEAPLDDEEPLEDEPLDGEEPLDGDEPLDEEPYIE